MIFLLTTKSCGNRQVRFEVPEPEGSRDQKAIPKKYVGKYKQVRNSDNDKKARTLLDITDHSLSEMSDYSDTVLLSSLDGNDRREADSIRATLHDPRKPNVIEKDVNGEGMIQFLGDTVIVHYKMNPDFLFEYREGSHMRSSGGALYLNTPDSTLFVIQKLVIRGDTLFLSRTNVQDAAALSRMKGTQDTLYLFQPSKRAWRQFIKEGGFRSVSKYVRVKP